MNGVAASLYREYKIRMSSPRVFVENIANPLFVCSFLGLHWAGQLGELAMIQVARRRILIILSLVL